MKRATICVGVVAGVMAVIVPVVQAQYIGYVYPAGGQQGTTFLVTLGGQGLDGVNSVFVSGAGVTGRLVEYNKKMNPQEMQLLGEQLRELKDPAMNKLGDNTNVIARLEKLTREFVLQPQSASIANIALFEITIAADARPGARELRLGTPRGVSNPLVFMVGQLPEISPPAATPTPLQILGKEEQSLRRKKRDKPAQGGMEMMMSTTMMMGGPGSQSELDKDEVTISPPCTLNGQISSGAVDRYRFAARKGQRMVIRVQARELVPYMADAVPGWFQAVLLLCDAKGREVAYNDDFRFKPDPVILYEIPEDGEYLFAVHDAIFRGREDFVYRVTVGEVPFVTSVFPLGAKAGVDTSVEVKGWNLAEERLVPDLKDKGPGVYPLTVPGKGGLVSGSFPFALGTLPECLEKEPNNQQRAAQAVSLPVVVNGRIDKADDYDCYQFEGKAGDRVVAEVYARRLDSPLDSVVKLVDAVGKCIAINDDREDAGTGQNTHHADSYLSATLPASGPFCIQIGDMQHRGGGEYGYRLRISEPQPDFALRVVPSSVAMKSNSTASLSIYAVRQDGFTNAIRFALRGDTNKFSVTGSISGTQAMTRVAVKTSLAETKEPVNLVIEGTAVEGGRQITHEAVPAEDRMQAFLWRHLVPVRELKAYVFNPPPEPKKPPKKDEAKKEPKKPTPEFPQGMMVHLSFDQWEPNGNITDRTGRNNNGRAYGSKWTQLGKQSGAYEFATTNSCIVVTNAPSLNMTQVTVAVWFRTSASTPARRYIVEKHATEGYAFGITGTGKDAGNAGRLFLSVCGHECVGDNVLTDGMWHHVAATFDGTNLRLYQDGKPQGQVTGFSGAIGVNTNAVVIGMNKSCPTPGEKDQAFNGALDELMIFNHALKESDVQVVIASTKPKFTKDQVARRLVELKELLDRGLLMKDFYERKVKECEVTQ